jgi:hypothetical protein
MMKILELLDELEEMMASASSFPLTGGIIMVPEKLQKIISELRAELPDVHQ